MANNLRIFISHKMPKDTELASAIGRRILSHGSDRITVRSAEDFLTGSNIVADVDKAISETDLFVLLYSGDDENWNWCLIEAGKFLAFTAGNPNRQIIVLHDPAVKPPSPLSQYISVPVVASSVTKFLEDIYLNEPWAANTHLDESIIAESAKAIVALFGPGERLNFDLVPNFSLSFVASKENLSLLDQSKIPPEAVLEGTQRWELLFDKNVSLRLSSWGEISEGWSTRSLYEYEISRMILDAMKKIAPEGCYIRPEIDEKLYRLILRRYEESSAPRVDGENRRRLWFYFSASPLDIPIFWIGAISDAKELVLYHLINVSWFTRRKLIEDLYMRLRARLMDQRLDAEADARLIRDIKDAIVSIDIQSTIRRITNPADVEDVFEAKITIVDQEKWLHWREAVFEASAKNPPDRKRILDAMFEMAQMNALYYKLSAEKFAEIARSLKDVPRLPSLAS